MKKVLTAMLALTFLLGAQALAGSWKFAKVFPDTNFVASTGVHGIAVDKVGKIWVVPYGTSDSIFNGVSQTMVRKIFVFNPDGTPTALSGKKTLQIGAKVDTLVNSSRGMRADANGNIVYAAFDTYYQINYLTGVANYKVAPIPGASIGTPAFTSANEMITSFVAPGQPVFIYDGTFGLSGTAIASVNGFARTVEVSKDGNDIYQCGYTNGRIYKYHSSTGTLGTYTLADSLAIGCQVESIGWNKKDGYLYASSGPVDTINYGKILPPWNAETWYAFNTATKAVKDSIVWNQGAFRYPYPPIGTVDMVPRPRGIAFSVSGDTAYVAGYNYSKGEIQMFTRTATSVEPINNAVPNDYKMSQNYPNPFNPSTEIEFKVAKAGMTTLKVYDMLGKEVATLVDENLAPGTFKTRFDASRLSSGTYVYTLSSNGVRISNKMMLLK